MAATFIGIDPGCEICGVSVIQGGIIVGAWNLPKEQVYEKISKYMLDGACRVVIEDIRPYSMRLTPQIIDTCKVIGEMVYRLKIWAGMDVTLVTRNQVKKWIFDSFPEAVIPLVEKKMAKKWVDRKPSFVFVDDKIVTEAMKHLFQIKQPAPGKGYQYGLKEHSWQALAVAAYLMTSTS